MEQKEIAHMYNYKHTDKSKDTKTMKKHKFVNEIVLGGYFRLKKDNHIVLPTRAASVGDSVVYLES